MTHSPTPDEAPYTPGVSELVEGYAQGAEGRNEFTDRVERRREAMRTIAQAKVDAVAEYKAQPVSDAEVEAAAQAHWMQEREDQAPYAPVYADEWHELDWSVMEHHRRRVRPILEAVRGAR